MDRKNKKFLIRNIIIIIILLFLIVFIFFGFSNKTISPVIRKFLNEEEIDNGEIREEFYYKIYDNQDDNNIKILISFYNEDGIEYIITPDNQIINSNNRKELAIDYIVEKDIDYLFKVKFLNRNLEEETININDNIIGEKLFKIEREDDEGNVVKINFIDNTDLQDYTTYYQIGERTNWVVGSGIKPLGNAPKLLNNIKNSDNTITMSLKSINAKNNNTVIYSKKYSVDELFGDKVYTISYILNGGTPNATPKKSYTIYDETFTLPTNITKTGTTTEGETYNYDFEGWTGSNGNTKQKTVTIVTGQYIGNLTYTANLVVHTVKINIGYSGKIVTSHINGSGNRINETIENISSMTKYAIPGTKFRISSGYNVTYNHGWYIYNGNTSNLVKTLSNGTQYFVVPNSNVSFHVDTSYYAHFDPYIINLSNNLTWYHY